MTQREFVLSRLRTNGRVTRNECLRNYISRLSAIIYDLRQEGFDFECYYQEVFDSNRRVIGRDYVYKLIKTPKEFQW